MTTSTWDTVNEPAYTEPVKAGKPIWVNIYTYYDPAYPPYIVASAGRPIYDASKKLVGVVGAEIHLLKLSEFLQKLNVSRFGQVFIIERNGMLVANSGQEKPFTLVNNEIKRFKAIDSPNPVVQSIAKQLQQHEPDFKSITNAQKLNVNFQGENYNVHIVPWRDQYGLDWLVVTSIPERTFMAQINANTQISILIKAQPSTIWISTIVKDNTIAIKVKDNGLGISEEIRPKLFNPFFTTKSVGKGTGLGLAISYQIIKEKHGGKLSCYSIPGKWTEFVIELPLLQSSVIG